MSWPTQHTIRHTATWGLICGNTIFAISYGITVVDELWEKLQTPEVREFLGDCRKFLGDRWELAPSLTTWSFLANESGASCIQAALWCVIWFMLERIGWRFCGYKMAWIAPARFVFFVVTAIIDRIDVLEMVLNIPPGVFLLVIALAAHRCWRDGKLRWVANRIRIIIALATVGLAVRVVAISAD